jgi:hypothetical protein
MKESYEVRPSQSPWPRAMMRHAGQPAGQSVHRGFPNACPPNDVGLQGVAFHIATHGKKILDSVTDIYHKPPHLANTSRVPVSTHLSHLSLCPPRLLGVQRFIDAFTLFQAPTWERTTRVGFLPRLLAKSSAIAKNFPKNRNPGHNRKINAHLQKISRHNPLPLRHLQESEKNYLANRPTDLLF